MKNQEVARVLYEIADILEITGISFKPAAYRKAARNIENASEDINEIWKQGKIPDIPGVGKHIAEKIDELLRTGKLSYLERIRKDIPPHLTELLDIQGIGPKKAKILNESLGIRTADDLEKAVKAHKIRDLPGFGDKSEDDINEGLKLFRKKGERMLLGDALSIARELQEALISSRLASRVVVAGSVRRMKETIGDLDILSVSENPAEFMEYFIALPDVERVLAHGTTKSSVILKSGLQVDMRLVDEKSLGAALQYFTGSKEHGIAVRDIAIRKGYRLSEYGLFDRKTDKMISGRTEDEIYRTLGLQTPPPELRENSGEVEAAMKDLLPEIIRYHSLKGDFHVHSSYSDGFMKIEEIAKAAAEIGYEYISVSDHSKSSRIAHGLSEDKLQEKMKEIDAVQKKFPRVRILKGAEVDILPDGSLDYDSSILKKLDIVIASVHSRFKMPREEMTERIVRAVENPYVDILGHPTGRLINEREPYELDLEKVFDACLEKNVYPEINSSPSRLDLKDAYIRSAVEKGVRLVIDTDAHNRSQMDSTALGIAQARRGWATGKDIINTKPLKDLEKLFKRVNK